VEKKFAQQENGSAILSGILQHRASPLSVKNVTGLILLSDFEPC
jgi:hypothetical protein